MIDDTLTADCFRYDTTRALFDATATVDGSALTMHTAATLPEIFERTIRDRGYDIAELGLTFYLRLLDAGLPYVALPIFPNRVFRHSCVFVNADAGITRPAQLAGRTIGEFGTYGQDSGVWAKGILADEYGFHPERSRWVIGGLDKPMAPFDFIPHPHPAGVDVTAAPEGACLSAMLDAGEIDALFSANVPQCVLDGSPDVARLFPDAELLEREYHRRTGIFPIMHVIVVRRDLLRERPGLAREIFRVFNEAKDTAAEYYRCNRRLYEVQTMVPWFNALVERNAEQFGDDWWPYGIAANRPPSTPICATTPNRDCPRDSGRSRTSSPENCSTPDRRTSAVQHQGRPHVSDQLPARLSASLPGVQVRSAREPTHRSRSAHSVKIRGSASRVARHEPGADVQSESCSRMVPPGRSSRITRRATVSGVAVRVQSFPHAVHSTGVISSRRAVVSAAAESIP